jgi:hypothetical protein
VSKVAKIIELSYFGHYMVHGLVCQVSVVFLTISNIKLVLKK